MKCKKIFAILLGTLLFVAPLSACKSCDSDPSEESSGDQPSVETSTLTDTVSLKHGIDFNSALGNASEYAVVISAAPTETEQYAADYFIDYVRKITGKKISYEYDSDYTNKKVISIGQTQFLRTSGATFEEKTLGLDGFIVKSVGEAIVICGGGDRGTMYGVQDLLEYQLGVKWLTSTKTVIPEDANAKLYKTDRTEIPAIDYRVYLDVPSVTNENKEFSVASRFTSEYLNIPDNMGGNFKMYQGIAQTHNSLHWVNTTKYLEGGTIKKEYMHAFANDGMQTLASPSHGDLSIYAADICYSDGINDDGSYSLEHVAEDGTVTPTSIAMAIEGMKTHIRNDKSESNYYMFGQMDLGARACICKNCVAAFQKYGDSGIALRFINALASAVEDFVEEENITREIKIVTFAYTYTRQPPVVEKEDGTYEIKDITCDPRDNVVIRLAPIGMIFTLDYEHEMQDNNSYGSDYMEKWAFVHDQFFIWDYTTYFSNWYYYQPTMVSWPTKIKQAQEMGIEYFMLQSNYLEGPIYQTIMERYVASKLLWNPNYDLNEIIAEFHSLYFGEAAMAYTQQVEKMMTVYSFKAMEETGKWQALYATKGLLNNVFTLIEEARAAIENSNVSAEQKAEYLSNLQIFEFQPRYMYLYHYMEFENNEIQRNIEVKKFIEDVLAYGGKYWGEGTGRMFDLENLIYR